MAPSKVQVRGSLMSSLWTIPKNRKSVLINTTAVVRIEAPKLTKNRASIDLVAVLNISTKLTASVLGHLKKAMKFVIAQLDNGDCLYIVAFDNSRSDYTTEIIKISSEGRESAEKMVDGIVAGEHTGSISGVKHAVKILEDRPDKTRQGFVMLVSDGSDTRKSESFSESKAKAVKGKGKAKAAKGKGNTSTSDLGRYPVHTMGLGKDHDPKELLLIAQESKGTYSSITEDLNSKIMEAFVICLAGLKSIVAVDTCINVKNQSSLIEAVGLKAFDSTDDWKDDELDIELGVLYAGEVKDSIFDVHFYAPKWEGNLSINMLTATVSYTDVQSKLSKAVTVTEQCNLEIRFYAGKYVKYCRSELTPFPMVLPQMARMKVLNKFSRDKLEKEVAQIKKQGTCDDPTTLQMSLGKRLQQMWADHKKTEDYSSVWTEAHRIGADMLLEHIDNDIDAILSCLERGSGLGCVYSWLLTYETQRAAYTGLPAATVFLTPAMKKMLQEAQQKLAVVVPEEDATAASSAASSQKLAPPVSHLVDALEQFVKSVLEKSGGAGAAPGPNDAAGPGKPAAGGGGEPTHGNSEAPDEAEASKTPAAATNIQLPE
ncbi:hypothetical protein BS78_05G117500 [Paspalum vaginatum]|nr:hypothetical protein BS78_05G117500 [Paspalum vaginatum]